MNLLPITIEEHEAIAVNLPDGETITVQGTGRIEWSRNGRINSGEIRARTINADQSGA